MGISELGAWGEFVGGIAGLVASLGVIGSLVYLSIQIRQTRNVVMAQAFQARSEALQDLSMRIAESPSLSAISAQLRDGGWPVDTSCFESLSLTEQAQYRHFLTAHLHRVTNLAQQHRDGLLTDEYYEQGIRGTIVVWMMMWEAASVQVPISPMLHEIHKEALAVEPSDHEQTLGGTR